MLSSLAKSLRTGVSNVMFLKTLGLEFCAACPLHSCPLDRNFVFFCLFCSEIRVIDQLKSWLILKLTSCAHWLVCSYKLRMLNEVYAVCRPQDDFSPYVMLLSESLQCYHFLRRLLLYGIPFQYQYIKFCGKWFTGSKVSRSVDYLYH